jgi:glyceraldehyde 3-phosphate dehydrogenase
VVSSDLVGDAHSSTFSAIDTLVFGGNMAKVIAWCDNEWRTQCASRIWSHMWR